MVTIKDTVLFALFTGLPNPRWEHYAPIQYVRKYLIKDNDDYAKRILDCPMIDCPNNPTSFRTTVIRCTVEEIVQCITLMEQESEFMIPDKSQIYKSLGFVCNLGDPRIEMGTYLGELTVRNDEDELKSGWYRVVAMTPEQIMDWVQPGCSNVLEYDDMMTDSIVNSTDCITMDYSKPIDIKPNYDGSLLIKTFIKFDLSDNGNDYEAGLYRAFKQALDLKPAIRDKYFIETNPTPLTVEYETTFDYLVYIIRTMATRTTVNSCKTGTDIINTAIFQYMNIRIPKFKEFIRVGWIQEMYLPAEVILILDEAIDGKYRNLAWYGEAINKISVLVDDFDSLLNTISRFGVFITLFDQLLAWGNSDADKIEQVRNNKTTEGTYYGIFLDMNEVDTHKVEMLSLIYDEIREYFTDIIDMEELGWSSIGTDTIDVTYGFPIINKLAFEEIGINMLQGIYKIPMKAGDVFEDSLSIDEGGNEITYQLPYELVLVPKDCMYKFLHSIMIGATSKTKGIKDDVMKWMANTAYYDVNYDIISTLNLPVEGLPISSAPIKRSIFTLIDTMPYTAYDVCEIVPSCMDYFGKYLASCGKPNHKPPHKPPHHHRPEDHRPGYRPCPKPEKPEERPGTTITKEELEEMLTTYKTQFDEMTKEMWDTQSTITTLLDNIAESYGDLVTYVATCDKMMADIGIIQMNNPLYTRPFCDHIQYKTLTMSNSNKTLAKSYEKELIRMHLDRTIYKPSVNYDAAINAHDTIKSMANDALTNLSVRLTTLLDEYNKTVTELMEKVEK